jgi:acyl-CoA thioester hydrolase
VTLLTHRVVVRFRDCDPLGHVNNAVYSTYLEQARFALWRAQLNLSAGNPAMDPGAGVGFILARAEIDFRAQARSGDAIDVQLSLGSFGRSSLSYTYELRNVVSGVLVAEARTVQVWFDYRNARPVAIDEALAAKLSRPAAATEDRSWS